MMNKIAIISGVLFTISTAGVIMMCSSGEEAKASLPKGYSEVSYDAVDDATVIVVKHNKTGCYYTYMDETYSGAFTQMFVKENGVSVPYCDK